MDPAASFARGGTRAAHDRALRPRSGSSAKALLLTILGEFVLPSDGGVWTSTVVQALGLLGVEERNARQALGRLAEQGTLQSRKEGRRARWQLTAPGRRLLVEGTERIYALGRGDDAWDGRWLVVLCSVPEDQRTKRHQLRTQLEFAGFGFVAPGVAVSPHLEREAAADTVLEGLGLRTGALVFRAEAGGQLAADDVLARAWDLDSLAAAYTSFIDEFADRAPRADEARFLEIVRLVHSWRRFPFLDPGIPARLLPTGWPGHAAHRLFRQHHDAWSAGAQRWYAAAETTAR